MPVASFHDCYWAFRINRGDVRAPQHIKLWHEQTVQYIRHYLPRPDGHSVFDLGCENGILGQMFCAWSYRVTGSDVSTRVLMLARPYYDTMHRLDLNGDATLVH